MNVDHKIFTEMLMLRLVHALQGVIGEQQSAFLPGRLIDDSVGAVQQLIWNYDDKEDGIAFLFLDQEKAYDRVSHEFPWKSMSPLGIPALFIRWIQILYNGAKIRPFVNGYFGKPINVLSGVRQRDLISCPLFIIAIQALARRIAACPDITGVNLATMVLKTLMYADDTAIILRNQEEATLVKRILDLFSQASGSRINWDKSYLLRVGGCPEIHLGEIKTPTLEDPYEHLGIPVGTGEDHADVLRNYRAKIIAKCQETKDLWLRCFLSMKGRIQVANSLIMSRIRYQARFLDIRPYKEDFEREYWQMVWDGRQYKKGISRVQACKAYREGGAGAQDLEQIVKASVYPAVQRAIVFPDLPWAQLARCLFVDKAQTRTPIFYPAVRYPWTQWLCGNFSWPQDFRWFYLEWKSIMGKGRDECAHVEEPKTPEVLNKFFWYHHRIGKTPGAGAKKWGLRRVIIST